MSPPRKHALERLLASSICHRPAFNLFFITACSILSDLCPFQTRPREARLLLQLVADQVTSADDLSKAEDTVSLDGLLVEGDWRPNTG